MRKLIFSIVATLLIAMSVAAQTGSSTVAGVLKEKASDMPVEFATVALHEAATGQTTMGCLTDSVGRFHMEKVPAGKYYVEGSFVGYRAVTSDVFSVNMCMTADVGTIYIMEGEQLDEVVVEGRRPSFVAQLDRKVFNVGQDVMGTSGSASDLMQNIPSVEVDMDGNVSLRGS